MNKKSAIKISLGFMMGVVLTLAGLLVFYSVFNAFFGFLIKGQAVCDTYLDNYDNVVNTIKGLEPQKKAEEQFVDIQDNCALIAFSAKKESFVNRPDKCFQKSCLCMCYTGVNINAEDCEKAKHCTTFDNIEEIKGTQKISRFEEQVYINGLNILEISRIDNTIKIAIKKQNGK